MILTDYALTMMATNVL